MVKSESKRSFCAAGKTKKMATTVLLPRCREVAAVFSRSDRIGNNKLNKHIFYPIIV